MYQVASFMRNKCFVNIDEMINFNISSNAVRALNLFMFKYSEESEEKDKSKKDLKKEKSKSTKSFDFKKRRPMTHMKSQSLVANNEGAVISMFNHTGVELSFFLKQSSLYYRHETWRINGFFQS